MKYSFLYLILFNLCSFAYSIEKSPTIIDDFSGLNKTKINQYVTPYSYSEISSLITKAKKENLKISIAGIRHSQGGHAFYNDAIVINLKNLNKIIDLDLKEKLLTVQAGVSWKEVQQYLNEYNLAVKIMQFANMFTVGGALSVNANGIDPHYGLFIESVRSIKIMLEDGKIVQASRTENPELFKLAIGGYGLFGIILEATLEVVPNDLYERENRLLSLEQYMKFVKNIKNDKRIGFHFANLVLTPGSKKLFSKIMNLDFFKIEEKKVSLRTRKRLKKLRKEWFVGVKKLGIGSLRKNSTTKSLQWIPEILKNGNVICRNNIMSPPVSHMYCPSKVSTDLLQEYFIPVDNLPDFLSSLEFIAKKMKINFMNIALRYIQKNNESFLTYCKEDCIGIVLYFSQKRTEEDNLNTQQWTQFLIDTAIKLNGAYYLPIQLHASKDQIKKVYPCIGEFFKLKKKYDPTEIFMNHFYTKYV